MLKNLAIAAALVVGTVGLAASADAGYGHRHYVVKKVYKPVYVYKKVYKPVYFHKHHCHYAWIWKHGHKVWACVH